MPPLEALILVALCKKQLRWCFLWAPAHRELLAPDVYCQARRWAACSAMVVNDIFPERASVSRRVRAGGHGRPMFGAGFARGVCVHRVRVRDPFAITTAVLPLMLVSVIAYGIALRYLPNSIMTEKLARRGLHTNQDYETNALKQLKVEEVMARDIATVVPEESVRVAADRFANGDLKSSRHHALPIVDSEGHLKGLVTQGDLLRAQQADPDPSEMSDVSRRRHALAGRCVSDDERVFDAHRERKCWRIISAASAGGRPAKTRRNWIGYINRASVVMGSWRGHLHEESVRETTRLAAKPGVESHERETAGRRNRNQPTGSWL